MGVCGVLLMTDFTVPRIHVVGHVFQPPTMALCTSSAADFAVVNGHAEVVQAPEVNAHPGRVDQWGWKDRNLSCRAALPARVLSYRQELKLW